MEQRLAREVGITILLGLRCKDNGWGTCIYEDVNENGILELSLDKCIKQMGCENPYSYAYDINPQNLASCHHIGKTKGPGCKPVGHGNWSCEYGTVSLSNAKCDGWCLGGEKVAPPSKKKKPGKKY